MNAELFALTPAAAHGEVWRLWTGHLVHYDFRHFLTNAIAIAVPISLIDRRSRRSIVLSMTLLAPVISLALLMGAHFDEYRGASALALAVWVASALALLRKQSASDRHTGAALIALAIGKLAFETAGLGHLWTEVAPLPLAHIAGAIAGAIAFITITPAPTPHSQRPTPLDQTINTAQY
ncbi:MAG TPA: rhombosortase [Thermoanaerobaculia bacterium]|nr:rhombosortase [Thermoanaerobaculia bacterium]